MILPLTYYDNPILRKKGEKVEVFDKALKKFAQDMLETMHAEKGIGLAAHQVGNAIMMCVLDLTVREGEQDFEYILDGKTPPIELIMPMVLVNPVLKLKKDETVKYEEGCLSFPNIRADIERPDIIECKYQDLDGVHHVLLCDDIFSRVIQHEVDHLNGILFIDRMPKSTVKKLWPTLEDVKNAHK